MADRCNSIDPLALLIVLLVAYWATFGVGWTSSQPPPHTIGEVIRG